MGNFNEVDFSQIAFPHHSGQAVMTHVRVRVLAVRYEAFSSRRILEKSNPDFRYQAGVLTARLAHFLFSLLFGLYICFV